MAKNLVIVESPAKAKTIEGYLGSDFVVKSSYGHIRDLASKGLAVKIDEQFQPEYEVPADKKKLIAELKQLVKKSDMVWLASDEDREGEAIAWHLFESLGLTRDNTKRIVFNEITRSAISKAIENPREIDYNLVNAQQARRILDRLVGYELSPVLWKKVRPSLSAGRVQSVTVRLIVERERERDQFSSESAYKIIAYFQTHLGKSFKAELNIKPKDKSEAASILNLCNAKSDFQVNEKEVKPAKRTPAAPFTTSTLQQEAARKLGFSVSRTMSLAQRLYEAGKITYMRTDSVNLSDFALDALQKSITDSFGADYFQKRIFKSKAKGAQEAHECIRPTDVNVLQAGADASERRLYELILKRTLASQMSDAQLEKTTVTIHTPNSELRFQAKGEVLVFDGFLRVYMEGKDDEDEQENEETWTLPPMKKNDPLSLMEITASQRFTHPPARYSEASLVKKLEELGIGRPSTYAPTISTILKRNYVVKEDREGTPRNYYVLTIKPGTPLVENTASENTGAEKAKLFPTDVGIVVNDFLMDHFSGILDFHFTAKVEKQFDEIASGLKEWSEMIQEFYGPFHQTVLKTSEVSGRATGKRLIGVETNSGKNVYALVGRFGPMVQIGEVEDEEKPKFASIPKEKSIHNISFEEAMKLFELPRVIGTFENEEMLASTGRFGPYIRHTGKFYSIPKGENPLNISVDRSIEIILAKREADANKLIQSFEGEPLVQILNGRWGPYIAIGKDNVKIPKGTEVESLTRDMCLEIQSKQSTSPQKATPKKKSKPATRKK